MNTFSKLAMLGCMATTMVLSSCSDDPASTTTEKNYFPLTVGNTWTYDGIETESKGGTATDIDTSAYMVTTKVDASLTYQGRSSYRLIDSSSNGGGAKDTTYLSKSGSQIYTYIELLPSESLSGFGVTLDLGSKWVLMADENQTSWTILDTTITGLQIPNPLSPGTTLPGEAAIKITGSKEGTSTITAASKSVTAQEYDTKFAVTVTAAGGLLTVPFNITSKTCVSEDIGIVKRETLPTSISVGSSAVPINGSRETLKTYTVIK